MGAAKDAGITDPLVDPEPFLGVDRDSVTGRLGRARDVVDTARRITGSLRYASHHSHGIPGAGTAGGGRPGHLSLDHDDAISARRAHRARLFLFGGFLRLHHL